MGTMSRHDPYAGQRLLATGQCLFDCEALHTLMPSFSTYCDG
jgi:hypothetical protein